ncbi:MAG: hypothetical protein FWF76_03020, partial [Oscillospiraceae bacterium]|nr:hypothetical protein [Oscillospiraceae bacterium]
KTQSLPTFFVQSPSRAGYACSTGLKHVQTCMAKTHTRFSEVAYSSSTMLIRTAIMCDYITNTY